MTELKDIEESIRYSCRHNPMYGDDLIKKIRTSFEISVRLEKEIQYLKELSVKNDNILILGRIQTLEAIRDGKQIPNEDKQE